MSVCEPNYWDTIINGVNPGDKEFADLLNILDFPLESLEGDELSGDWDASKFQNMGPIPTDTLTGLAPVSQGNVGGGSTNRVHSYSNPFDRKFVKKELPKYVEENKGTCTPGKNLMSSLSNAFRTPSPVSVLESSGSCSSGKSLSAKSEILIPVRFVCKRARSKRSRPSINPWLKTLPVIYVTSAMRKTSNAGKKRMKMSQLPNPFEAQENSYEHAKQNLPEELDAMEKKPTKKCMHCEVTKTPQWREGPYGPKTLCNACGVRYRSGRLFPEYRPAASPTFVPSVHSNSHKKVVEMRQKAIPPTSTVAEEVVLFPPVPEFVPMRSYEANYMMN